MLISGDTYRNFFIQKGPFSFDGTLLIDDDKYNDADVTFGFSGFADEPSIRFNLKEGEIRYQEQIIGSYDRGTAVSFVGDFYHTSGVMLINNTYLTLMNTFQYPEYFYVKQGTGECHLDFQVQGKTGDFLIDYNNYFISGDSVQFDIHNTGDYFRIFGIDLVESDSSGFVLNGVPDASQKIQFSNSSFDIVTTGVSFVDANNDSAFPLNLIIHTNYGDVFQPVVLKKLYTGETEIEFDNPGDDGNLLFAGNYKPYNVRGLDYGPGGFSDMALDIQFNYLYGGGNEQKPVGTSQNITGLLTGEITGYSGKVTVTFTGLYDIGALCNRTPKLVPMTGQYSGNVVYSGQVTFTGSGVGTGLALSNGKSNTVFTGINLTGLFPYSGTTNASGYLVTPPWSGRMTGTVSGTDNGFLGSGGTLYHFPIFADNTPIGYFNSGYQNQTVLSPSFQAKKNSQGQVFYFWSGTAPTQQYVKTHQADVGSGLSGTGFLGIRLGTGALFTIQSGYTGIMTTTRVVNNVTGAQTYNPGDTIDTALSSGIPGNYYYYPNYSLFYGFAGQTFGRNFASFSSQQIGFNALFAVNGGTPAWRTTAGVRTGFLELAATGMQFPQGFTGMYGFNLKQLYIRASVAVSTGSYPGNVTVSGIYTGDTTWSLLFTRSGGADQVDLATNISGLRNPISGAYTGVGNTAAFRVTGLGGFYGAGSTAICSSAADHYITRNTDLYINPTESGFYETGRMLSRIRMVFDSTLSPTGAFLSLDGITAEIQPVMKFGGYIDNNQQYVETGCGPFVYTGANSFFLPPEIESGVVKSGFIGVSLTTGATGISGINSVVFGSGLITGCAYSFDVSGLFLKGAPLIAYTGSGYYKKFGSYTETGLFKLPCDVMIYTGNKPYLFIPGGDINKAVPFDAYDFNYSGVTTTGFVGASGYLHTVFDTGTPTGINYAAFQYLRRVFALSGSGYYKYNTSQFFYEPSGNALNKTFGLAGAGFPPYGLTGSGVFYNKSGHYPSTAIITLSGESYWSSPAHAIANDANEFLRGGFDITNPASGNGLNTWTFDYLHQDFSGLKYRPGVAITGNHIGNNMFLVFHSGVEGLTGNKFTWGNFAPGNTGILNFSPLTSGITGLLFTERTGVDEVAEGYGMVTGFVNAGLQFKPGYNLVTSGFVRNNFNDLDGGFVDVYDGNIINEYSGFAGQLLVRGSTGTANYTPGYFVYEGAEFYNIPRFDQPRIWGNFLGHWEHGSGVEIEPTYQTGNLFPDKNTLWESGFVWVAEDTGFFNPVPFRSGYNYLNLQTSGNGPQKLSVLKYPLRVDPQGFVFLKVPIFGNPVGNVRDLIAPFNVLQPYQTGTGPELLNSNTYIAWSDELNVGNALFGDTGTSFGVFSGNIQLSGLADFEYAFNTDFEMWTGHRMVPLLAQTFTGTSGTYNMVDYGLTGSTFIRNNTASGNIVKANFADGVTIMIDYKSCNPNPMAGRLDITATTANITRTESLYITGLYIPV